VIAYVVVVPVNDIRSAQLKFSSSNPDDAPLPVTSPIHEGALSKSDKNFSNIKYSEEDLQTSQNESSSSNSFVGRRLPPNGWEFLKKNHPLNGLSMISEAQFPKDWLSYFFAYITQQVFE
jgi:hypothetical protein